MNIKDMVVLWIDDERFALTNFKTLLERRGARVHCGYSLSEGKILLEFYGASAHLVILDIMMPIGEEAAVSELNTELTRGGYEAGVVLARWARDRFPNLPIIAFSSAPGSDIPDWLELQGIRFIPKTTHFASTEAFVQIIYEAAHGNIGATNNLRVFIVHGHDDQTKLELKNYLQNVLQLPEPILLHERPSLGRTVIEKFEDEAAGASLVFVILTPDDSATASGSAGRLELRARQNVVFELGYFIARFGRRHGKVILLHKQGVEIPSDLAGVVYIDVTRGVEAAGEAIRREVSVFRNQPHGLL